MDATTIDLEQMGRAAKTAAMTLGQLTTLQKNTGLLAMAAALETHADTILAANKADLAAASALPEKFVDRLALTRARIADMAAGVRQVGCSDCANGQGVGERSRLDDCSKTRAIGCCWHDLRSTAKCDGGCSCLDL